MNLRKLILQLFLSVGYSGGLPHNGIYHSISLMCVEKFLYFLGATPRGNGTISLQQITFKIFPSYTQINQILLIQNQIKEIKLLNFFLGYFCINICIYYAKIQYVNKKSIGKATPISTPVPLQHLPLLKHDNMHILICIS